MEKSSIIDIWQGPQYFHALFWNTWSHSYSWKNYRPEALNSWFISHPQIVTRKRLPLQSWQSRQWNDVSDVFLVSLLLKRYCTPEKHVILFVNQKHHKKLWLFKKMQVKITPKSKVMLVFVFSLWHHIWQNIKI